MVARRGCWCRTCVLQEREVGAWLRLVVTDEPGFWETNGYHNYGDPWREQRYWGD
jgi:DMSO/TMAO reductase YedYZ molybdopterin-dependent catalytic subunit